MTRKPATRRLAYGRYLHLATNVEIVWVPAQRGYPDRWITRNPNNALDTYDAYATKADAVADLDVAAINYH